MLRHFKQYLFGPIFCSGRGERLDVVCDLLQITLHGLVSYRCHRVMNMAAQGLAFQADQEVSDSPTPDDLTWMSQIWMGSGSNSDRMLRTTQPHKAQQAASLPTSPAGSTALQSQAALSASDAILNVGQLRKDPPNRTPGLQSQAGDALLQAFSEMPQQQSLKVNTAQLNAPNPIRTSQDSGARAASPFWLQRPTPPPANPQVLHATIMLQAQSIVSHPVAECHCAFDLCRCRVFLVLHLLLSPQAYSWVHRSTAWMHLQLRTLNCMLSSCSNKASSHSNSSWHDVLLLCFCMEVDGLATVKCCDVATGQSHSPLTEPLHPKAAAQAAANAARAAQALQQRPAGNLGYSRLCTWNTVWHGLLSLLSCHVLFRG